METRDLPNPLNPRNILVICPDSQILGELAPLISQQLPLTPVTEVTHYPDASALGEIVSDKHPTLCFLDVATNREAGLDVMTEVARQSPATLIVVLLAANEPDLILRCLRQGATEFLLRPISGEQLRPVLERLSQITTSHGSERLGGAKVVSVMPVKGACGASTIASNLAFQWKRLGIKKILLADLDPAAGTISFLLKLKSTYTFLDALSRAGTLDSDLWKGLVLHTQGLDVLLSPDNPMDIAQDLPDPGSVIDFCRQAYENVTLDLPGPYSQWALSIASHSDDVLVVTTNELPALRAAQRVLQNFDRHKLDRSKVRLVVNRYTPDVGLNQDAIETALHTDVFHVMPSDYESVQKALVEGRSVAPSCAFGKSLQALAERLAGKPLKAEKTEKKKSSGLAALFSSLASRIG